MTTTDTGTHSPMTPEDVSLGVGAFDAMMDGVVPNGAVCQVLNALNVVPVAVMAKLLAVYDVDPTDETRNRYEAAVVALRAGD